MIGQVFTPPAIVHAMLALRTNRGGGVLEPSCGDGAFSAHLNGCVAIEIDASLPSASHHMDFFAYPLTEKFATVIGNPPYVRYRDIPSATRRLLRSDLFDRRSNLYLFFIEKCLRHLREHGELIFITPRDFLKTTSSVRLNKWLYTQGTITHAIELGDARVFHHAVPNCLIWRFEKGSFDRRMRYASISQKDDLALALQGPRWQERHFIEVAGQLIFSKSESVLSLQDIASVKVGAVSGADDIYIDAQHGNVDFVCSTTRKTGQTRRMIWADDAPTAPAILRRHQARLLARRVRSFDKSNWWHWGRGCPKNSMPRVYVNGKTRHMHPFFVHPAVNFDGSILAIFPHNQDCDLAAFCAALNEVDWQELGFVCDGRFLFTQRSLAHAPLPDDFRRFAPDTTASRQTAAIWRWCWC